MPLASPERGIAAQCQCVFAGGAVSLIAVEESVWEAMLTERFREKGLAANLKAFALGRSAE